MGAVLLQADITTQAQVAKDREQQGGRCKFDRCKNSLQLRPIAFIDRSTMPPECSFHSYVGEVTAG